MAAPKEVPSLLLAQNYDGKKHNPEGWWMSEKLDGIRAYWDGSVLRSREGNDLNAPPEFTSDLPSDMTLDGELFAGRGKFTSVLSAVKQKNNTEAYRKLKYCVFDVPSLGDKGFEERQAALKQFFEEKRPRYAELVKQTRCEGKEALDKLFKSVLQDEGEGVMLRQPGSKYEGRRSKTLLRLKMSDEAEARVKGYKYKEDQKTVMSLECEMESGTTFFLGYGLTNEARRAPVGTIVGFKFQELFKSGKPRHPVFQGIRPSLTKPGEAKVRPNKAEKEEEEKEEEDDDEEEKDDDEEEEENEGDE